MVYNATNSLLQKLFLYPTYLVTKKRHVAIIADNIVQIHDKLKDRTRTLEVYNSEITSAFIDRTNLIIGFKTSASDPDFCVVGLKKGLITHHEFMVHGDLDSLIPAEVTKIISDKQSAYFGYSTGKIFAYDLANHTCAFLGKQEGAISDLALNGPFLVSSAKDPGSDNITHKTWDIHKA